MPETGFPVYFCLAGIVLAWMALRGILGGRTIFEFPAVAALMGLAWVVPQGIELQSRPYNPYSSDAFWIYVTACFLFLSFGFVAGRKAQHRRIRRVPSRELAEYNLERLLTVAAGLTLVGYAATFMMSGVDTSTMDGQWTGVITFYSLLAKLNGFGLCLSVLIFARTRSPIAIVIAVIAALPIFQAAVFAVRREQIFDLCVLTAGAWYLARGRYPPRAAVVSALVVGTVILNSAGNLRSQLTSGEGTLLTALTSAETYTDFDYFALDQGEASEVGLAQYDFWYVNETGRLEYGADHWNRLVHQYIPAFLVGRDFKESLMFSTLSERLRTGEEVGAFSLGSTRTGFSDSYTGFGIIGVLIFFAIGYLFGFLYANAFLGGLGAQYFYLILLAEGLKAITHSTGEFLSALPFSIVVSVLALRLARRTRSTRGSQRAQAGYIGGTRIRSGGPRNLT